MSDDILSKAGHVYDEMPAVIRNAVPFDLFSIAFMHGYSYKQDEVREALLKQIEDQTKPLTSP